MMKNFSQLSDKEKVAVFFSRIDLEKDLKEQKEIKENLSEIANLAIKRFSYCEMILNEIFFYLRSEQLKPKLYKEFLNKVLELNKNLPFSFTKLWVDPKIQLKTLFEYNFDELEHPFYVLLSLDNLFFNSDLLSAERVELLKLINSQYEYISYVYLTNLNDSIDLFKFKIDFKYVIDNFLSKLEEEEIEKLKYIESYYREIKDLNIRKNTLKIVKNINTKLERKRLEILFSICLKIWPNEIDPSAAAFVVSKILNKEKKHRSKKIL